MNQIYKPLKNNWKISEDSGVPVADQIKDRVDSEDWYTNCKRYPLTVYENKLDKLCPRINY